MKNKQKKFSKKYKKELSNKLYQIAEDHESAIREMLEKRGIDTSKINIIDRAKFMVQYMPDVMEELFEKYGTSKILMNDDKIKKEATELIEKKFHEGLSKKEIKIWNIYYILLHCKLDEKININENVELIPFDGWPCNDYFEIINKIFYNLGAPASRISEETFEKGKEYIKEKFCEKNPVSLLIIKNVKADVESEVYENTKKYAGDIILCMSRLTNSSIERRGWVVEGKMEGFKQILPTVYFEHYHPHRLEGVEQKEIINRILKNIDKNHLLKLALKYEKEALSDDEEEFAIMKRWSALEFIAEDYAQTNTSKEELLSKTDINGIAESIKGMLTDKIDFSKNTKIENKIKSSIAEINHKNAKEKVRDLLEYAKHPISKSSDEKDIIDVIYQHRNCLTHLGGCYKYSGKIKECPGPKYCRESELDLQKLDFELGLMILHIIGRFIDVEFQFRPETPVK